MLVENGLILAVGPRQELAAAHPGAAAVDFGDAAILPSLVNAHTHLELTDYPEWARSLDDPWVPESFVDWVLQLVKVRRSVSAAQVKASLSAGLHASLAAGTGAIGDILTTLDSVSAYRSSPLCGIIYCEVLGRERDQVSQRLAAVDQLIGSTCAAGLRWGISPHAPYTLDEAAARQVSRFARGKSLPLAMHLAETREEVDFLQGCCGPIAERLFAHANWQVPAPHQGGLRPLAWAGQQDCLMPGSLVVHGVHVDPSEVERVARQQCSVVLCPRSNSRFGPERAPLGGYRSAGVNLALGTDSMASSPSLSIWEEMAFARSWFDGVLTPSAWLEVATLGGATALGLNEQLGSLTPGKEASFQVVALSSATDLGSIEECLCSCGHPDIKALYMAGRPVLGESVHRPSDISAKRTD